MFEAFAITFVLANFAVMKRVILTLSLLLLVTIMVKAETEHTKTSDLTTIPALQELGHQLLEGKQGSIVAIRPETGEILALVSNSLDSSKINRAITGIYSPGSTIKTAQALTLLSEEEVTPQTTYPCKKGFWKQGTHVGCHPHSPSLNLVDALSHSCNTWFCESFMDMVADTIRYETYGRAVDVWNDYMQSYGLGHTLGVDVHGEAGGLIPNAEFLTKRYGKKWNERQVLYFGMGQGLILVTPLQLCNLAVTIANRGHYFTPYLHRSSVKADPVKYYTPHVTMATQAAYRTVITGMRMAVMHGTCKSMNTKAYAICGKTGTVENAGEDHSVFIGFAPATQPKIAICVFIEHGGMGADVAVPIASAMIKKYMGK